MVKVMVILINKFLRFARICMSFGMSMYIHFSITYQRLQFNSIFHVQVDPAM
jgi:hypothetical protein